MIPIALGQINPTVGDIDGNAARIKEVIDRAEAEGAQVVTLPELAVTGYPPEDLLLKSSFVAANRRALEDIAAATGNILAVVGFVGSSGGRLHNSAAMCHRGQIVAVYDKQLLPNYGVFDDRRYFDPGTEHVLIETPSGVLGVCVCEDAWSDAGPMISQGDAGAQIVININASTYHKHKLPERTAMLARRARRVGASIVYLNTVSGQDELVFDGASLVLDPHGGIVARLPQFEEHFAVVNVPLGEIKSHTDEGDRRRQVRRISVELNPATSPEPVQSTPAEPLEPEAEIYAALCLGLRDYVRKNHFDKVVIGLSGGIDSSLTAVIAADALGADKVLGVAMPSSFSTSHSLEDAKALAGNLGIELLYIPIAPIYDSYISALEEAFGEAEEGVAEENLQSRARGNLLMAVSNRYGHLLLATGNKSEMATGYATLYGDMAGGFALLKDVLKTEIYALASYRNSLSAVIPESVLSKAPSAELRPDQKDEDSLPPYDVLDPILEAYIEHDAAIADLVEQGHDAAMAAQIITLVDRAEYKRRQAPPGPKVTVKAFGRDRRLPITNHWREPASAGSQDEIEPASAGSQDESEPVPSTAGKERSI